MQNLKPYSDIEVWKQEIFAFMQEQTSVALSQLAFQFSASPILVHKVLDALIAEGKIEAVGYEYRVIKGVAYAG